MKNLIKKGVCQLLVFALLSQTILGQSAAPNSFSPTQISQIQSLSPSQTQNLVKQFNQINGSNLNLSTTKSNSNVNSLNEVQNNSKNEDNDENEDEIVKKEATSKKRNEKLSRIEQMLFDLEVQYQNDELSSRASVQINERNQTPGDTIESLENKYPSEKISLISSPQVEYQYGYSIFRNHKQLQGDSGSVSVNDDYRIGPGDQFTIYIWGSIEQQLTITVNNKGEIFLPKVGIVKVSGTTFKSLPYIIKRRLSKHYVNFDVSVVMDNIRMLDIFVLGEISKPGVYRVSSLSTAFLALLQSGGPTKMGSMRNIELKRNGKVVKVIDLYNYLLNGDNREDISLQNFDTIFIPPIKKVVKITGEVKRPGIFEIQDDTNLYTLIHNLSGGFLPSSDDKQVQILRIVNEEENFKLQKVADFPITSNSVLKSELLHNADIIIVKKTTPYTANDIYVKGAVFKPGRYEYKTGMTLADVLKVAEGLNINAYKDYITIYRTDEDGNKELITASLEIASTIKIYEKDVVEVFEKNNFSQPQTVNIFGDIENPGKYELLEEMSLKDLLIIAKLEESANYTTAEIVKGFNTADQSVVTFNPYEVLSRPVTGNKILLENNDYVFIREKRKQYNAVTLQGEVKSPGVYLMSPGETISDVIVRAGGYTKKAFLKGIRFYRKDVSKSSAEGKKIFLEQEQRRLLFDQSRYKNTPGSKDVYENALTFISEKLDEQEGRIVIEFTPLDQFAESKSDIELENNDRIFIPQTPNSVTTVGGVVNNNTILYNKNQSINYYIEKSGGFSKFAERNGILIVNADGSVSKNKKTPEPGDIIYIPEQIDNPTDWLEVLSKTAQIIFNVAVTYSVVRDL